MAIHHPTRPPARRVALLGLALLAASLVALVPQPSAGATTTATPVMGPSSVTASNLAAWYRSKSKTNGATVGIDTLARFFIEEGAAEGVAGDVAFAQSIVETGYFGFSSRVPGSFNNFSGLGAVDGGSGAEAFPDARTGVRAQIQHLRAYADPTVTTSNLAYPLVNPRFRFVLPKGKAPLWEQFGNGIWASSSTYATLILGVHRQIVAFAGRIPTTTTTTTTTTTLPATTWRPFASPEALVAQAHRDLLSREPSSVEVSVGAGSLRSGAIRPAAYLASLIEGEASAHSAPVVRLYLAALGRLPDRNGLQYWTRRHAAGITISHLAGQFLHSAEFERRYGTPNDAGFVDQLYRNVLGRAGDPSGVDYWTRRISGGQVVRTRLLVQFSESPEHIRGTQVRVDASIVYLGMMLRPADPSVLSWWNTKRTSGSTLDVLTSLVLQSSAYQLRFS